MELVLSLDESVSVDVFPLPESLGDILVTNQSGRQLLESNWPVWMVNGFSKQGVVAGIVKDGEVARIVFTGTMRDLWDGFQVFSGLPAAYLFWNQNLRDRFHDGDVVLVACRGCYKRKITPSDRFCAVCKIERRERIAKNASNARSLNVFRAGGGHSDAEWQEILLRFGSVCLRCGTSGNLTKDHVQPITRGGTDYADNLQPLCRKCNSWKSTRTIDFRGDYLRPSSSEVPSHDRVSRDGSGGDGPARRPPPGSGEFHGNGSNEHDRRNRIVEAHQAIPLKPPLRKGDRASDEKPETER